MQSRKSDSVAGHFPSRMSAPAEQDQFLMQSALAALFLMLLQVRRVPGHVASRHKVHDCYLLQFDMTAIHTAMIQRLYRSTRKMLASCQPFRSLLHLCTHEGCCGATGLRQGALSCDCRKRLGRLDSRVVPSMNVPLPWRFGHVESCCYEM